MKRQNIGSDIIIFQEQLSHQKKLNQIYYGRRSASYLPSSISSSRMSQKHIKKHEWEEDNHINNIKMLIQKLNKPRTINDRYKNPHDFYAFPVYFFRNAITKTQKKSTQKMRNKKRELTAMSNGEWSLSKQKIRQHLPYLTTFQSDDLQEFASGLTKLIITYNVNDTTKLQKLQELVLQSLPSHYPQDFLLTVHEMFQQIQNSIFRNDH